jgi:hypothetical protein
MVYRGASVASPHGLRSAPSSVCGNEPIMVIGNRAAGSVRTAAVAEHGNAVGACVATERFFAFAVLVLPRLTDARPGTSREPPSRVVQPLTGLRFRARPRR